MARGAIVFAAWWAALTALWLLAVGSVTRTELVAGLVADDDSSCDGDEQERDDLERDQSSTALRSRSGTQRASSRPWSTTTAASTRWSRSFILFASVVGTRWSTPVAQALTLTNVVVSMSIAALMLTLASRAGVCIGR